MAGIVQLYRQLGDATSIYEHRIIFRTSCPTVHHFIEAIKDWDEPLRRAEAEMGTWCGTSYPHPLSEWWQYPQRLKECDDAPLALFYTGTAQLNQSRVINPWARACVHTIRTRHHTEVCRRPEKYLSQDTDRQWIGLWSGHPCPPPGTQQRLWDGRCTGPRTRHHLSHPS